MIDIPFAVFETTGRCNLRCRFCYNYYKAPGSPPPERSSYSRASKTLRRLYSLARIATITMSGGEPFLAERFPELVLYCRMKGSRVKVITNGFTASRADYAGLVAMKEVYFQFPVHSADARTHDAITGVAGSWERSVRSVREVMSLGGDPFVVIVLTSVNRHGAGELLEFIEALGVRRVLLLRYNIGGAGIACAKELMVRSADLKAIYATAERFASQGRLGITSNVCTPVCLLDPADYPHIGFTHCSADPLKLPLTIDFMGNVRKCNHSPTVLGNIFREKPDAIYARKLPDWEAVPGLCAGCAHYERCRGGCRAASEQYYGSAAFPDPYLELDRG